MTAAAIIGASVLAGFLLSPLLRIARALERIADASEQGPRSTNGEER